MPKRSRSSSYGSRRPTKRRRYSSGSFKAPRSVVPLQRRGYTPNTRELKVYDTSISDSSIGSGADCTIDLLFNPVAGTDMNQRIGRKARIKSIFVRGYLTRNSLFTPTAGTAGAPLIVRTILVWDAQPNGTVMSATDLFQDATALSISQLNINYRDRFKILKDKVMTLDPYVYTTTATQAVADMTNQIRSVKIYKKVNLETIWNATNGGSIADIASGALYLVNLTSFPTAAAGNNVFSNFRCRVRYDDS